MIFNNNKKIIVLIPARNEEKSIKNTILSVKEQTIPVTRIIVVANNCDDQTAKISLESGAEVMEMLENKNMKAGALNYALERIIPALKEDDYILVMDADTTLSNNFIEKCLEVFDNKSRIGAISSIFTGRPCKSILGNLQIMEFWRYRRQILRNGFRAFVLTGTASIFLVKTLKDVKEARRKGILPNYSDSYYDTYGRTEDNEITLAILTLGYDCPVVDIFSKTDVMETISKLIKQRERWYNGALINLRSYGLLLPWYMRWIYWKQQIGLFLSLILFILIVITITINLFLSSLVITNLWLVFLLIVAIERTITVWQLGWRARLIAITIIFEQLYSILLLCVFGWGLINLFRKKKRVWHST